MGAISKLGLSTCVTCPSRFFCIMTPTKDVHNSDMESWVFYVLSRVIGLSSFNFKRCNEPVEKLDSSQYACVSSFSETNTGSRFGSRWWKTSGKETASFLLHTSIEFQEELSKYARDNFPRLRDIL